ncbi:MAG: A/G-specific adenine glycosylase [Armatimonadota bacterium]|nr:MAG: A/G-specific adenine glycosylase [Armatimonadota bacterium]
MTSDRPAARSLAEGAPPAEMAAALDGWFRRSARRLPWRETPTPYRVWIAEVMLQQTTVAACIPRFERFIRRFPDIRILAAASLEDVLSEWEGLGYYSRARNLWSAARMIVDNHGGELPSDIETLRALPGIGEYTAGAIRSIAFDLPAGMVDANIRRVLGRVAGIEPSDAAAERRVRELCLSLSASGSPRIVNQALMELGSLVCFPRTPLCGECPFRPLCRARLEGKFDCWHGSLPKEARLVQVEEVCITASVEENWLISRPCDGRWRGMWEFPRARLDDGFAAPAEVARSVMERDFGVAPVSLQHTGSLRYRVTVHDTHLHVVSAILPSEPEVALREWRLVPSAGLVSIPLPSPMRRIARSLISHRLAGLNTHGREGS